MFSGRTWGKIQRTRKTMCRTRSWVDRSKRPKWWAWKWTHGHPSTSSSEIPVNQTDINLWPRNVPNVISSENSWIHYLPMDRLTKKRVGLIHQCYLAKQLSFNFGNYPYLCYSFWIIDLNQLTKLHDLNYSIVIPCGDFLQSAKISSFCYFFTSITFFFSIKLFMFYINKRK